MEKLDFQYTDSSFIELGQIENAVKVDIEIGKYKVASNDFELVINEKYWNENFDKGSLFYVVGTEYGGLIGPKEVDTATHNITFRGQSLRGLLEKEYVQPPDGYTHLVLKGTAEACLKKVIGNRFGEMIVVEKSDTNIDVNYQIRDMNLLDAIERFLLKASIPSKLEIKFYNKQMHVKAVPIRDISEYVQLDDSYNLQMIVGEAKEGFNHILALGNGELLDRIRINLFKQEDGTWGDHEVYKGFDRKTFKFEDPNAKDIEELKQRAIESCEEKNGSDSIKVTFGADEAELFDIVGAKEKITGISFKEKITQKILSGSIKNFKADVKIEHKVGDN